MIRNIIVICTGNICRSPIAEVLLRSSLPDCQISSAGTAALVNHPADPTALEVATKNGWDLSAHRARQATQSLLTSVDLILALDQGHANWVRNKFPHLLGRTHKLGRWRSDMDIADPYRQPVAAFERAFTEINSCVEDWVMRLKG